MDDTGADIPSCSQPPLITRISASQPVAANVVQTETPARSSVAGRRALEMFTKKSKASKTTPSKSQLAAQAIIDEKEQNMNFQKAQK